MKIVAVSAALMLVGTSVATNAEPFLIELPLDWTHASDQGLRDSLGFVELEIYRLYDATYMVVDARNEAFVETYFRAAGAPEAKITPISLVHQSKVSDPAAMESDTAVPVVIGWSLGEELAPFHRMVGN